MSYRDRRDSYGSRDRYRSSSSRRSPSRSPPPKPRSDKELPESFGRIPETTKDDDSNVLQRMSKKFANAPLGSLTKCLEGTRKIKVWTRNFKEVRGICTGYVVAFDKHWNLVMRDVDEVYLKRKKYKTPFFDDLESAENFSELPKKTPKEKKDASGENQASVPVEKPAEDAAPVAGGKKKRRRKKKKGSIPQKRYVKQLLIRGDSIVMAAILEAEDGGGE